MLCLCWFTLLLCLATSKSIEPQTTTVTELSNDMSEIKGSDITTEGTTEPDESTTLCPELNVKTLLDVQKNSVLLKLVSSKRSKRQTGYSSYYPVQSGQTGVEARYQTKPISDSSARKPSVNNKQQRQAPKQPNYHFKQPVKGYRNPSLYMRHPVKGSYYKASGNRRQFQGRYSSTTVRAVKKKFRPSPVFA